MNKHLLALATGVATLALTTAAFAQSPGNNRAYTEQVGTGAQQSITIDQSGSNGDVGFETKRILQSGGGNNLTINQSGDRNTVGGFFGVPFGNSQSSQIGSGNSLRIDQTGGSQNGVIFNQNGKNNGRRAASAPPGDRSPTLYGSPVDYGVYPGKAWNYVSQSNGTANGINFSQTGDNNGLIVLQDGGVRNAARLVQTSAVGTTEAGGVNLAYFNQSGVSDSSIRLIQTNSSTTSTNTDFNSADIRQLNGQFNVVARYVGNETNASQAAKQTGSGLDLFAQQTGSYNQLSVNQVANNSRIEAVQNGTGVSDTERNRINVDQGGNGQNAVFQQNGFGNTATVTQSASFNVSNVSQFGNNNTLTSTQGGGGFHYLLASQNGDNNLIDNTQTGTNQYAIIMQNGSFNKAVNNQSGNMNSSYISQGMSGNTANVLQSGNNNVAMISQNATAIMTVRR